MTYSHELYGKAKRQEAWPVKCSNCGGGLHAGEAIQPVTANFARGALAVGRYTMPKAMRLNGASFRGAWTGTAAETTS